MNFLSPSRRKRKLIEKKKRRIQSFPSDEEEDKEHALDDYFDNSSVDSDRYSFVSSESYERSIASDKARHALNVDSPERNSYDKYAIHQGDNETQTPPTSPKDAMNKDTIDTKTPSETPKDDSTPKARPNALHNAVITSPESPQDRYAINDQEEPLTPTYDKYAPQPNDKEDVSSPGSGVIVSSVNEAAMKTTSESDNITEEDKTTPKSPTNEESKERNLSPAKGASTPNAKSTIIPPVEEDEESPLFKGDKYAALECQEPEQTDLESDSPQDDGGEPKSLQSTPNKSDVCQQKEGEEEETKTSPSVTKDDTVTGLSPTIVNSDDTQEHKSSEQSTTTSSQAVTQEDKDSLIQDEVDAKETEATESNTSEPTSEENEKSETSVDDPEKHEAPSADSQGQATEKSETVEHDAKSVPEGEKIVEESTKDKDAVSESDGTATHTLQGSSTHSSDDDHTYEKLLLDVQKNCSFDDDSEISDLEDDMDFDFMTCEFLRYLDDKENNTSGGDLERFSPRDPTPRGKSVLSPRNRSVQSESPNRSAPDTPIGFGRFDDKPSPARKHSSVSLSGYIGITPHNTPQKSMDDAQQVENTQETVEPPQSSSGDLHKRENSEDGQISNTTLSTSSALQGIKIMDEQSSSTFNTEVVTKSPVSPHPYDEIVSNGVTLASAEGASTTTKSVDKAEGTADGPAEEAYTSAKEGDDSKVKGTADGPAEETNKTPREGDNGSIGKKPQEDFASVLSPGSAIPHDDAYGVWRAKGLMSPEKKTPTPKNPTRKTTPVTPRLSNKKVTFPAVKETTPTTMRLRKEWRRFPTKKSSTPGILEDFLPKQHKKIKIDAREFSHLLREWKRTCLNSQYEILPGGILSPLKEPSRKRQYRRSWPKQSPTNSTPQDNDKADSEQDTPTTDFCPCSMPFFSGNEDMIDFFLPKLGVSCTCGKQSTESYFDRHDPTSLENILRPWQVTFLKSFGIRRGDQFVKAHHKHAGVLARAMRVWRMRNDMIPVRTVSCGMALHIWSRTCKIHVRSIRRQIKEGVAEIKPPTALEVLSTFLVKVDVPEERRLSRQLLSPPVKGGIVAGIDDSHAEV